MKDFSIPSSDLSLDTAGLKYPSKEASNHDLLSLFFEDNLPRLAEGLRSKPIELDPGLNSGELKSKALVEIKHIREISFSTLERIAKDADNKNSSEALMILIDIVPSEGSSAMKQALAMLLANKPEHASTLMELMADPYHRSVRNLAGNILKNQIGKFPSLCDELMDRVEGKTEIRNKLGTFSDESLCLALSGLPNGRAISFIKKVLDGPHSDPAAQMIAKISLSRIKQ